MTSARTPVPASEPLPAANDDSELEPDWCPQDIVEEWGFQSFPASVAPANW